MGKYKYSKYNITVKTTNNFVYLLNSFSGSFCKLEKTIYKTLCKNNDIDEDIKYYDALIEQGIIVPVDLDETGRVLFEEQTKLLKIDKDISYFIIAPTIKCNMNCYYCFEKRILIENEFSQEVQNDIIRYIKNNIFNKELEIHWFGGEPLLKYNDIISFSGHLAREITGNGVVLSCSMTTNGLLLTKEKCESLCDFGFKEAQITLDGTIDNYSRIKGVDRKCFEKVLQNINDCSELIKIKIRLNITRDNVDDIKKLLKELIPNLKYRTNISFDVAEVKGVYESAKKENLFNTKFLDVKKDIYSLISKLTNKDFYYGYVYTKNKCTSCGMISANNIVIGPRGEFYKCDHHIGDQNFVVGNVKDGLYFNDAFYNYCSIKHPQKCLKCKFLPLCYGGCRNDYLINKKTIVNCLEVKKELLYFLKSKYLL